MLPTAGKDTRFRLSEARALELAAAFGTPLYVVDEAHFRERIRRFKRAFAAASPDHEISYASKANSALAVLAIAHRMGLAIDVASEGEFRAALAARVPAAHCHFHGSNKTCEELGFALSQGIGQIIIDNFHEIDLIASLTNEESQFLLRLAPGVDPKTHVKIATGRVDTKFGFSIADGSAEGALQKCLALGLPVIGFHFHVGSQLTDATAQSEAARMLGTFAREVDARHNFRAQLINFGGGLGAAYQTVDDIQPVEEYCYAVVKAFREGYGDGPPVRLAQEPGRWLIAESGVTLYEVGALKTLKLSGGEKIYVSVDGGLSDNPRPLLYGSHYEVECLRNSSVPNVRMTVAGRHCETDTLFEDVRLPRDLASGDLLQVLATGAYNASMASNYNRFVRPAMVLLRESGTADVIQTRETWRQLLEREVLPDDLIGSSQ